MQSRYAATLALLALLLCGDAVFMVLHGIHVWTPWLNSGHYSLEADRGPAEIYQYIKQLWIVVCLAAALLQTRIKAFAGWALLFAFLLLDDAAEIHEHVGFWLGQQLGLSGTPTLRPDDFGELTFAAFIGAVIFAAAAISLWRGGADSRHVSRDILLMVIALGFFGVAVDAVHVVAYFKGSVFAGALTLIEDGGEMLIISAITCYVFDIVTNGGALRIDLFAKLRRLRHRPVSTHRAVPV